MHNMTLGVHYVPLSQLQLVNELGEESTGERWVCEDVRGIHGGMCGCEEDIWWCVKARWMGEVGCEG